MELREMRAYSLDFRRKIIEAYTEENLSYRQLAARFRVALSFVVKLIKQWRETGDLNPRPHGGGTPLKLSPEEILVLADIVQAQNDATLMEIKEELKQRTGTSVSCSTISRVLKRLNLTRRRKRYRAALPSQSV
jgi:transposase